MISLFVHNLDSFLDDLLKKTLWLWLPFFALFHLIHDIAERKNKPHGH